MNKSITIFTCERCGSTAEVKYDSDMPIPSGWEKFYTKQFVHRDLCSQCKESLTKWWEAGKQGGSDAGKA